MRLVNSYRCGVLNIYKSLPNNIQRIYYNKTVIMISGRIRFALRMPFCNAKIMIPQMQEGNKYCHEGKFNLAIGSYSRVIEIMKSAKMDEQQSPEYIQAVIKLAASQFINAKYQQSTKTIQQISSNIDKSISDYLDFLNCCIQHYRGSAQQQTSLLKNLDIKQIVQKLLSSTNKNSIHNYKYPILSAICNNLNNAVEYQKLLVSLIERSPKAPKSQTPLEQITQIQQKNISPQLQLLLMTGIILQNKTLTTADKYKINSISNQILKKYEENRPKQVYKPLLTIIMSLIGEKHYMSAEGMIGFIKTQQQTLIASYASNDKNLINNIYRMLVTRANNQKFEVGWQKQEQVHFGSLVAERIIKAPLLDHSLTNIIC